MILNIEDMIIEYSRQPSNTMSNIKKGKKKNSEVQVTKIDEYISDAIQYCDSENEEDEDDGDGENEEEEAED